MPTIHQTLAQLENGVIEKAKIYQDISAGGPGSGRRPGGGIGKKPGMRFMTPKDLKQESKGAFTKDAKAHAKAAAFHTDQASKTIGGLSKLHERAASAATKASQAYSSGNGDKGDNHAMRFESLEDDIQDRGGKT